jgi:hypothetical protein
MEIRVQQGMSTRQTYLSGALSDAPPGSSSCDDMMKVGDCFVVLTFVRFLMLLFDIEFCCAGIVKRVLVLSDILEHDRNFFENPLRHEKMTRQKLTHQKKVT